MVAESQPSSLAGSRLHGVEVRAVLHPVAVGVLPHGRGDRVAQRGHPGVNLVVEVGRPQVVGGGGCLLKNFFPVAPDKIIINSDICATAKGYEYMAEVKNVTGGAK